MRVALLGTGPVGKATAALLAARGAEVALVVLDATQAYEEVTGPLRRPPAAVVESGSHRDPALAEALRAHRIDLAILAWWPYLVTRSAIDAVSTAMLNFHPSLLPHGRGKDPNFWALVAGEPFGVTIHHVTEQADEGPIAFQRELDVSWMDTGATLYRRAQDALVKLFDQHLDEILRGEIPRAEQPRGRGSSHRRSELDPASRIDLDGPYTARSLLDLLRARTFPPHPGAWFDDDGIRYEVRVEIRRADHGQA